MVKTAFLTKMDRRETSAGSLERGLELIKPHEPPVDSRKPMQRLGTFPGDNPTVNYILGLPGAIAPTDTVLAKRITLSTGGNVRPFYAEHRDSKSYIVPVIGRLGIRLGHSWMRHAMHMVERGEVAAIEGEAKRSVETLVGMSGVGYLFEVNMGDFDQQAVQAMAEPFVRSEDVARASAAQHLVWEVLNGKREPLDARSHLESWFQDVMPSN